MVSWYVALNDFEMVPVAPIINGITFAFTFHMRCISVVRALYLKLLLLLLLLFDLLTSSKFRERAVQVCWPE